MRRNLWQLHLVPVIAMYPLAIRFNSLTLPADNHDFCSWPFNRTYNVEIKHRSLTRSSCEEISEAECNDTTIRFNPKFITSQNIVSVPLESIVLLTIHLKNRESPSSVTSRLAFKLHESMETNNNYELQELNHKSSVSIHFLQLWKNSLSIKNDTNALEKEANACPENNPDDSKTTAQGDLFSYSEKAIWKMIDENDKRAKISDSSSNNNDTQKKLSDINWSSGEKENINKEHLSKNTQPGSKNGNDDGLSMTSMPTDTDNSQVNPKADPTGNYPNNLEKNSTDDSLVNSTEASLVNSTDDSLVNSTEASLVNSTDDSLVNSTEASLVNSTDTSLVNSTAISEPITMTGKIEEESSDVIIWPVAIGLVIGIPSLIIFSIAFCIITKQSQAILPALNIDIKGLHALLADIAEMQLVAIIA
ncbi:Hypothetical predicted protein [Octopus vulgaris]|uniref:Dentin sialophosphoprotein-like n=1 Tax=Octopus vulgaris TaxID=6645 RepID=A0AA36FJI7_OCTVU|nr:Hypothetical predicted protein [Octopus vulgaris]